MILLDVNVVFAAHRSQHPTHSIARPWFDALLSSAEPFGVPLDVWGSFLRLASNRRVLDPPTSREDLFAFIHAVRAQPSHRPLEPGPRHLELLRRVADGADAKADLIPDAVLAAIALEHDATIATLDRDFGRFDMVRHVRVGA